jgi:nicotinamide mononucleotide (NMN) deamidase PncC
MEESLAAQVGAILAERGETLAVAEGASGGWLAHRLTQVPGSSAWFRAGIVAYTDYPKRLLLRVATQTIDRQGGISAEATVQMARLARRLFGVTWAIALTGYADARAPAPSPTPPGALPETPPVPLGPPPELEPAPEPARRAPEPGLTYLAVAHLEPGQGGDAFSWEERLLPAPDRAAYKEAAAAAALEALLKVLAA